MAIHYTSFVLPAAAIGLSYDTPFLVFGADTVEEIETIPLVTSLHRTGNSVMPFCHASMVLGEIPVTDRWAETVMEQYDDRAKVVIVRDPVPAGVPTEYAELAKGVLGPDLPAWLGLMLGQQLHSASRDVPCTAGEDPMSIGIDPSAPTTYPAWAHQIIEPAS